MRVTIITIMRVIIMRVIIMRVIIIMRVQGVMRVIASASCKCKESRESLQVQVASARGHESARR